MCRVVDTVLVDQETVCLPRHGDDRLLFGLKGTLNEYERDLLRQRSLAARYENARRGELVVAAPVGFVKLDDRLEKRQLASGAGVVPRARARPAGPARLWRGRLAQAVLRHHPPDGDQPDLQRCLCLW